MSVIRSTYSTHSIKRLPGLSAATQPIWLLIAVLAGLLLVGLPLSLAAALLAITAVLLLTLLNPLFGLALALLLGPLGALENLLFGSSLLDSGQLMLLLAFAAWIGRSLLRRELRLFTTRLTRPLLLFIFITAATLTDASSIQLGLIELLKWLEIVLIVTMVVAVARYDPKRVKTAHWLVLAMLLLAGLSQALIGIWQFGLRGDGPEHFLVLGNFYRAYGTFEQPNPYGGYMNLTALLALGTLVGFVAAWKGGRAGEQGSREAQEMGKNKEGPPPILIHNSQFTIRHSQLFRLFVVGTAAVTTLGLIFSWSRGAWLGFAAGLATLVLFSTRQWWQGFLLSVGGTTVAAVLLFAGLAVGFGPAAAVIERISGFQEDLTFGDVRGVDINDANYAVLERLAHWQAALDMARDDLWTGVGFGNYEAAYADYALINWPAALGHAHNYYLNLLAETGIIGLLAYLLLWGAVLWQSVALLRRLPWPERGIALGLTSCWVALSVHHLVDKLYVNNIYIHLGVMLALLQLLDLGDGQVVERVRTNHEQKTEVSTLAEVNYT